MRVKVELIIEAHDETAYDITEHIVYHCTEIENWDVQHVAWKELENELEEEEQ